ncbi:MAG: cobaltochelatase subunit CobN [Candidatus Cryptobacteroides sp.]
MKKKLVIISIVSALLIICVTAWHLWFSATKVAFINYQAITLSRIAKANNNPFIKIKNVDLENLEELRKYDAVCMVSMGLKLTLDQRELLEKVQKKGVPFVCTMITNPENDFTSMDSLSAVKLKSYIDNGGQENYRSMLNYIRKYIDKKIISAPEPHEVIEQIYGLIYHPAGNEDDDLQFNSIAEYHRFLKKSGLWKENAPGILITGTMGEPSELISSLEKTGNIVYPINSIRSFIESGHSDSVNVSALINMAHGRLGDNIVEFLKSKNIPLFAPLNVNRPVESWEKDKMGMSGGFLSQSVVTPEIDGALRSYVLFGHYKGNDGLQYVAAIPERLENFVATINNYIKLKSKPNKDKKVAIYYYKGPGQNAMTAGGMEVGPSLYNLLVKLRNEGYNVEGLPASPKQLEQLIQKQGAVFGLYAKGAFDEFMKTGKPELISKEQYEEWVKLSLRPEKYAEVVNADGEFPGEYMATSDGKLGVARVQLGNIVLLPQNAAGKGDNSFKIVHGTDAAPPHTYIASYLWVQHGFKADVLIHFGTHGSLEFTPKKQVALCNKDWPDRLVGNTPHFYLYTIGNVGEGIIAKRRSYAGLQSYLTAPFMESNLRGTYRELAEKIKIYNYKLVHKKEDAEKASLEVKKITLKLGIHRELGLDSIKTRPYSEDDILRIDNFAEELATAKINGRLYTLGVPYEPERINSSVYAMSTDPIAYSVYAIDKALGRADNSLLKRKALFTEKYLNPAKELVGKILANPSYANDAVICKIANISMEQLNSAREMQKALSAPKGMLAMMQMMMSGGPQKGSMMPKGMPSMKKPSGKHGSGMMKGKKEFAFAVTELERTIKNVNLYKKNLSESPKMELNSMANAMKGGYTVPSPGGDPIANPNTIPTGRNLYGINAEATPSESAWEKGKDLAEKTIEMYRRRHNDSIPRKVSYTLWSGEFIETEGATIAQVLYMLGVEPIRDGFGRINDLKLIPSEELGRPRIDVIVQTSGQLRDLAASRLFLINKAVEMAAAAKDDKFENQVAEGFKETERALTEKGVSPKEARELASRRVFGGVNGNYGTGIQGMVMSSDRWESRAEIADTYLNNMGAFYGDSKNWEQFRQYAFEAALTRTDVVIQPRQSNTWGALSLDHVYEFMGGLNLAVRQVTGKDPDAYLGDYRNRRNMRMQEVKESIGVESRTTIFNPTYIKEQMKGGASSAGGFAEIVQNTFGWEVMKPSVIDDEMWDEIFNVYVKDKFNLGVKEFFEERNPAAIEEMTAVMLESARKGMWKASKEQIQELASLHVELVNKFKPSCSGFVCNNAKLKSFIKENNKNKSANQSYDAHIGKIRETSVTAKKGMKMQKETLSDSSSEKRTLNNIIVAVVALTIIGGLVWIVRRNNKLRKMN